MNGLEKTSDFQAELVRALQSTDETGQLLYDDVVVGDAMALLLISMSTVVSWGSLDVGARSTMKAFFARAGVSLGAGADEISVKIRDYFNENPLPASLMISLSQAFRGQAQAGVGVVNEAASRLASFSKSEPRVFDAFLERERPQGTFGGGNLARLALLSGKDGLKK